jgi:hypothetical protein
LSLFTVYLPNVKYTLKLLRQARPGGRLGGGGSATDRGENLNSDLPFKLKINKKRSKSYQVF